MSAKKTLLVVVPGLIVCVILTWLCTSIEGKGTIYEVETGVGVAGYRSDAARAIDAYERLMERYMDLTEGNLIRLGSDMQRVAEKLQSIDSKLTVVSAQIARIEQALGIEQPKPLLPDEPPLAQTQPEAAPPPEPGK